MKTKRIAGVNVNLNALPSREDLVNSALQSEMYYRTQPDAALEDINLKIEQSGLYNNVSEPVKEDKPRGNRKDSRGSDNT